MKLCYRGVSYEYTPPTVKVTSGEVVGKYRGLEVRSRHLQTTLEQPKFELQYRGVAYTTNNTVVAIRPTEVPTSEPISNIPVVALSDKARTMMVKQGRDIKKRQQVMLSRLATEVGLSTSVSDYWNRIQGKIHPTFRINYHRNHVSFS